MLLYKKLVDQVKTIQTQRKYQIVGGKIKQKVTDGVYSAGFRLPAERDLAELFSVGRSVIRDAIVMLELQGLVEVRQGSGAYVIAKPSHKSEFNHLKFEPVQSNSGPFEMLQARQFIESNIIKLAATKITKEELKQLKKILTRQKQAKTDTDKEAADQDFHLAIAAATQNAELVSVVKNLWDRRQNNQLWRLLHERVIVNQSQKKWNTDHLTIYQALERKDPDAAFCSMWNHLENVKTALLEVKHEHTEKLDSWRLTP